jgi:hypothetical protein
MQQAYLTINSWTLRINETGTYSISLDNAHPTLAQRSRQAPPSSSIPRISS